MQVVGLLERAREHNNKPWGEQVTRRGEGEGLGPAAEGGQLVGYDAPMVVMDGEDVMTVPGQQQLPVRAGSDEEELLLSRIESEGSQLNQLALIAADAAAMDAGAPADEGAGATATVAAAATGGGRRSA